MGVYRSLADADLVVEVVTGGAAAVSYEADDLQPRITGCPAMTMMKPRHMSVAGPDAVAVIDDDPSFPGNRSPYRL